MTPATADLIDTQAAVARTGRPRTVLYRWAREGRITRYGSRGKGCRLWDRAELPEAVQGQPLPEPPPMRGRNA